MTGKIIAIPTGRERGLGKLMMSKQLLYGGLVMLEVGSYLLVVHC